VAADPFGGEELFSGARMRMVRLDGEEIEISRAGRYTVWRAHIPVAAITVTGGQVSSCHWPG